MKKKYIGIFGAVAAVSVLSIVIGVTIAYLGANENKENTVTVGHGDVQISENFTEPSEMSMVNNDITKQVQVKNTGTVPAFVRVYAEFSDSELAKHATIKYGTNDKDKMSWEDFKNDLGSEKPTISSKWKYVSTGGLGGYFYYTEALKQADSNSTNDETTPLFYSVTIDYQKYDSNSNVVDSSNIDRIQPLEMIVYSELIQTVETGIKDTSYGYDYGTSNEWQDAWKSFLRVPNNP